MRILIISDTHSEDMVFADVVQDAGHYDVLIHAGDAEGSEDIYEEVCGTPFYYVAGNNDFFTDAFYERVVELDGCRIYMVHGHQMKLEKGYDLVRKEAASRNADIAVFGHSHTPVAEYRGGILLLNPGSLSWPRQTPRVPSYIVLTLSGRRVKSYEIKYLDLTE